MTGKTASRPFGRLSPGARRVTLWASGCAWVGTLIPLLACEREMRRAGGPGIIPFELAGTPERAERIMQRWGPTGQAAARRSLILDYPFLLAYAPLQALACAAAGDALSRRRHKLLAAAGAPLAWGQLAGAGFDAIENAALLGVLGGGDARLPALARTCATAKFALLGTGLGYCLLALKSRSVD
jgi:hypothetical protein